MNGAALTTCSSSEPDAGEQIRIRGIVQGVGFRPTVWRLATDAGLKGQVLNDGQGVLVTAWAQPSVIDGFITRLLADTPPLARIDSIERSPLSHDHNKPDNFRISTSDHNSIQTGITPDAATCPACKDDTLNPFSRRYRYPFTNCTHCGPRLSIIRGIPYDRAQTSMASFTLCPECRQEYNEPANRRFHAQPNACYVCGPKAWLERTDGRALCTENLTQLDDVDAACSLLQKGEILAIKGIGGFHLACDATHAEAVKRLREGKQRYHKPFALMARDLEIVQRYCTVSEQEIALLQSPQAPIVILQAKGDVLPEAVAPGQNTLGFMLPYTPLHHLLLKRMQRPVVLTSGNLCDEPQCIDNHEAKARLGAIAPFMLTHNRDIANRVDDSVVRVMGGEPRLLRRARGYAPATLPLPEGFTNRAAILAMGGELKNTFCLINQGNAILSQHMGDLENAATYADYQKNLALYATLYQHKPDRIAIDEHPEYLSSKLGRSKAESQNLHLETVQHHHAHVAACLADNDIPLHTERVLGVALDGLGYGADGTLWGGEFLLADYQRAQRLGTFKPVAMPGAAQAMREPWRNTYAHLMAEMGWDAYKMNFGALELTRFFECQPLAAYHTMLATGNNAPLASSAGRLFDAVAAATGICRQNASYEGQAAIELEAIVDQDTLIHEEDALAYPFAIPNLPQGIPYIEPLAMWQALLGDLILHTPAPVMAARFHKGLAKIIVSMIRKLTTDQGQRTINTVALTGGVFQNRILLEQILMRLEREGYQVLTHRRVPANDGGLALGQAMISAARVTHNERL